MTTQCVNMLRITLQNQSLYELVWYDMRPVMVWYGVVRYGMV